MSESLLPLALTGGEPAGIGPDICLDLPNFSLPRPVVILADSEVLRQRAGLLNKTRELAFILNPHESAVQLKNIAAAVAVTPGVLAVKNVPYVLSLLDTAVAGIKAGIYGGMVTAPIHKGIINQFGRQFSGHTEYLRDKAGVSQVVMMLAGGGLNVALATTHLPLSKVAGAITPELLTAVITIINQEFIRKFNIPRPRIAVCGLNPHAGEGGYLGREENTVIIPVLAQLRQQGLFLSGPLPADTVFQPEIINNHDVILAMYHDQGLPVLKYAAFGAAVNVTLGLPYVRTSVDHGTALTLAGSGKARAASLAAAVRLAAKML